jgi:hypothetical protein
MAREIGPVDTIRLQSGIYRRGGRQMEWDKVYAEVYDWTQKSGMVFSISGTGPYRVKYDGRTVAEYRQEVVTASAVHTMPVHCPKNAGPQSIAIVFGAHDRSTGGTVAYVRIRDELMSWKGTGERCRSAMVM